MPDPLILREGVPPRTVPLEPEIGRALEASGVLTIARTDDPGCWLVGAGTKIGVIRVGGLEILIEPKVDIDRIVFMMGYAINPRFWCDDRVHLDPAEHLPHALADAFTRLTRRALDQGVLKGYVTVDESLPVMRGRIREADQLRHHWGTSIPLEVRYDDYTVDVAENQILLAATTCLLSIPSVGARHRTALQRLRLRLADVTPLARGVRLPTWTASRLNTRYQPALELVGISVCSSGVRLPARW